MKFTVKRSDFLRAIGHVRGIVERRHVIPILSNVLVEVSGEIMTLRATDNEIDITESIQANVETPGSVTVPAHLCYEIVRKMPEGSSIELSLNEDGNTVILSSGHVRFTLQTLKAENFPSIKYKNKEDSFTLSSAEVKHLLDKTRFAISTDETRYYLNGVYLHRIVHEGRNILRAVATDGHRLALAEMEAPSTTEGMPDVIIPRKAVHEFIRLLEDNDSPVDISVSVSRINFSFGGISFTSRLIDATFPNYERVIPQDNQIIFDVDRRNFCEAIDRVSTIAGNKKCIGLFLKSGQLLLKVTSQEAGSATEEIALSYDGSDFTIGFNWQYLFEVVNQLGNDTLRISMGDNTSAASFTKPGDNALLYIILPMRLD